MAVANPTIEEAIEVPANEIVPLLCIRCRHPVTDESQRIELDGAHRHDFKNPDGVMFRIGCFRNAPGCTPILMPTRAFTWFSGYAWRPVQCAGCDLHLGWLYSSAGGDSFYGLILTRLVAERPAH